MSSSPASIKPDGLNRRRVTIFHRNVDKFKSLSSATSSRAPQIPLPYNFEHWGIQVANLDPDSDDVVNVHRFGLVLDKEQGHGAVKLQPEENMSPSEYNSIKLLYVKEVHGATSYSNEELKKIADRLISKHGKYNGAINNCQKWAIEFFNEACNLDGSGWAKFAESSLKFQSKKRNWIPLLAAPLAAPLALVAYEVLKKQ